MRKAVRHTCESHGFYYWIEEEGEALSSTVGVASSNSYCDGMSTQISQDQPSSFEKFWNVLFQRMGVMLTCPFP